MKRVEAWQSDNGQLEMSAARAKAWDLYQAFNNRTPGMLTFSIALALVEQADVVISHLQEYIRRREAEKDNSTSSESEA